MIIKTVVYKCLPILLISGLFFLISTDIVSASSSVNGVNHASGITFLYLALLLLLAKTGDIIEKAGQPSVLGEIGAGILLSMFGYLGLREVIQIRESQIIAFIAELGVVVLLFQIGLESDIRSMSKVGFNALMVAVLGVVVPFAFGSYLLPNLLFPDMELNSRLFLGASLVATSVGVTAYIFQEMKMSKTRISQTVLGAAVIDDILGLLVLAVVSAMVVGGYADINFIIQLVLKAFGFLAGAVILGRLFAEKISKLFSNISSGSGMKITIALAFALSYAYLATLVGLAPIVGAFAAGLILDAVCFRNYDFPPIVHELKRIRGFDNEDKQKIDNLIEKHTHSHVEDLVKSVGLVLIPIFFVYTGLQIDFSYLLNPGLYFNAFVISVFAIAGKVVAGIAVKGNRLEKLLVGVSMVPRGEVGLVFASVGKSLNVISNELFSLIVLVIIISTFFAPPILKMLISKYDLQHRSDWDKPLKLAHAHVPVGRKSKIKKY